MRPRNYRQLWAALMLAVACTGCRAPEQSQELLPSGLRPLGADTIDRGEVAEGEQVAFGMPIPRDLHVEARMDDTVYARGWLKLEVLSNFVRARVIAAKVETGPVKTVFMDAKLKRDPSKVVEVEVTLIDRGRVEMVVRDRVRQPAEEGLTEAERWKRAGLTPDGEVDDKRAE